MSEKTYWQCPRCGKVHKPKHASGSDRQYFYCVGGCYWSTKMRPVVKRWAYLQGTGMACVSVGNETKERFIDATGYDPEEDGNITLIYLPAPKEKP